MIENLLGGLVVVTGLVSRTAGEGTQILLNWQRKSCIGLSRVRYVTNFSSFASYVLYTWPLGAGNPDWFIFSVASFGVIGTGTVLVQMWLYRHVILRFWTCPYCGAANTLAVCTTCGKPKGT